ncbi:amidohydrolase family protein [Novosphingobium mangrovi (ex Huang et al. 2023)]|uniref:Amidohydrolase family protein n=1 Tax=Novosphingobium mangrovi (ex Huang et al. 2023) TaxID=2976432 RepID=A0ABT2I1M8_9SPHN|nr:amidohydrolase family protein [Novosphingobium mangrovi (ex Huang et al. 2023)]MCT2398704.1 amidohydrolase family protein [Novosphingobium mangrovi (ex Huang et al. 2023)]
MTLRVEEAAIEPDRPIVDPHLHLWDIPAVEGLPQEPQTFLLRDAARTLEACGHRITHTVFVECHAMYRAHGAPELQSLGETEFANGTAAMSASGGYGPTRISHRIVGNVDLCRGDRVEALLERHCAAAGERFRGVRMNTAYSPAGLFGGPAEPAARDRIDDPRFVEGCRILARMGLSLDVWCLHPQLEQLVRLADRVPGLTIVLDHLGTPDLRGDYASREDEAIAQWERKLTQLAERPNTRIKLSGQGMDVATLLGASTGTATSNELAEHWQARICAGIEAFTPARSMFASNFPPDQSAGSYGTIWNAFKKIAARFSEEEQDWLFRGTATEVYAIDT